MQAKRLAVASKLVVNGSAPIQELRRWLGPLGRYRPGLLRRDMALGFKNLDRRRVPGWATGWLQWQSPEERLLDQMELAGRVVYDIGAFTGAYCMFFAGRVGAAGRVVAFEPNPASFATLLKNLRRNQIRNVLPLRMALGDEHGQKPIYALPGMPTTASLARDACTPLRARAGVSQIERLDDLLRVASLPCPDFLKVDVEGLELEVLLGAVQTLRERRPDILIEVHGTGRREKAARVRGIADVLVPLGYAILHAESGQVVKAAMQPVAGGHLFAHATA